MSEFRLYENRASSSKSEINPWQRGYPPTENPTIMRISKSGICQSDFCDANYLQQKAILTANNLLYEDQSRILDEHTVFDERFKSSKYNNNNLSPRYKDDRRIDNFSSRLSDIQRREPESFRDESFQRHDRGDHEPDKSIMLKTSVSYDLEKLTQRGLLDTPVDDTKLYKRV